MAKVRLEASMTRSLAPYESTKFSYSVERECENTDEAILETRDNIRAEIDEYVGQWNADVDAAKRR